MPGLYRTPQEKRELESRNGVLQFYAVLHYIESWKDGESKITPKLILELQYRAIAGIYTCAGKFRDGPVKVLDAGQVVHEPPPSEEIAGLVDEMCRYVNENWSTGPAIHLASYLMWRLNWIHPFFGGNGRTARSVSYLALCAKLGMRLPGKITIPDHIVARRGAYIRALRSSDAAWKSNRLDLSQMESLMESVMAAQLVELMEEARGKEASRKNPM